MSTARTMTKAASKKRAADTLPTPSPKKRKRGDTAARPTFSKAAGGKPAHSRSGKPEVHSAQRDRTSAKVPKGDKGKGKEKQRSRPVTSTAPREDEEDSDEEDEEDAMDEDIVIQDDEDEDAEATAQSTRRADGKSSREAHQAQKALLAERRAAKPHGALIAEAKKVWVLALAKNASREERGGRARELMAIVRGKVQDVVFKHDASRMIQTVVKYGGQAERDEVAAELKGRYKQLVQNRYSKFLVSKLVRYSSAHRSSILKEFHGHVLRLLLHREASSVIADAYELWANASDRGALVREFYGKEVLLFRDGQDATTLNAVLDGADDERRKRVLTAVKENLDLMFNNSDKGAVSHAIVHHALWEYLREVNELSKEDDREKFRHEMFETCQELLAEMVHTRDGSRAVREFIAQGSAKDRKQIVKCFKPHLERIAQDDEAQVGLFTALDVIDDTKLVAKSIIADITSTSSMVTLAANAAGRRTLFYLLVPRTSRHFPPALTSLIAETDAARARTSKKDEEVRRAEVRAAASPGLLAYVCAHGSDAMLDPAGSLLVLEIMLYADGDKAAATEALLGPLAAPYPSADPEHPHAVDGAPAARLAKALLQGGHFDRAAGAVGHAPGADPAAFARAFVARVGRENTRAMARAGGAFVVAELCERVRLEGAREERRTLAAWLDKSEVKAIEAVRPRGCDILVEKINALRIAAA